MQGACAALGARAGGPAARRTPQLPCAGRPTSHAQVITWIAVSVMGLCIIASRKVGSWEGAAAASAAAPAAALASLSPCSHVPA